jgi:CubicO group peptidase (beta-lactamase class C family)
MRASALASLAPLFVLACSPAVAPPAAPPLRVTSATPPPAFRDPARRTNVAAQVPKLDALFADTATKAKLPGLAVGLVVDGDLVWSKGYGTRELGTSAPVDADTVFRIGSVTKTFTAVAAVQLRDAGRLQLDEPASRLVPELAEVAYPTSDSPEITLRHLLTHTSGLPRTGAFRYDDPARTPTEAEITASLRGFALEGVPGGGSAYSNLGVGLAGIAVGRAAGMRYRDYVTTYLLRPLGMTSTAWDREAVPAERLATAYAEPGPGEGAPVRREHWRLGGLEGAGGLYSTVHDMARWIAMHLQAYPARSDADAWPVKRASLREAMTVHVATGLDVQSVQPLRAEASGVGFAWHAYQSCALEDVVWHNGETEGYHATVAMAPARGVGLVALTNIGGEGGDALDHAVMEALDALARSGAIPEREPAASPAFVDARERLIRLFDGWDDAGAQGVMTPELVGSGGGLAKMHETRDALVSLVGACTHAGEVRASSAMSGRFDVACEKGTIAFEGSLAPGAPARFASLQFHLKKKPSEPLARAAARVAALTGRWDDATYDEVLYPTFDRDEMRAFFGRVARDHGVCKLGDLVASDGEQRAVWRLACGGGELEMTLDLDPHNGRAGSLLVVPPKGHGDAARCPR